MSYEKPVLMILKSAANIVKGQWFDSIIRGSYDKAAQIHEGHSDNGDATHNATTSSTGGAYEADD